MIDVLYEDNHLLVLNKPHGLLTEPSGTMQDSLYEQAKLYIKEKYQKKGNVFLGIVHRLDKPACGLVIFAKTSKALSRLNQSMREKHLKKTYTALVEGFLSQQEGEIISYLVHDDFYATLSSKNDKEAKYCKLNYHTLKKGKKTTLLEIVLETGRYHQIRAQLAYSGHPILGDHKYGSQMPFVKEGIALHYTRLELIHPVTQQNILFEVPLPASFAPI